MYSKHKDTLPEQTIQRIRTILQELEIEPTIKLLKNTKDIYSAYLVDHKHGWHVNGKGTTETYCMASAYGESMERLQAYYIYSRPEHQNPEPGDEFMLYPDEKIRDTAHCKSDYPFIYEELRAAYALEQNRNVAEISDAELDAFLPEFFTNSAVSVPYYGLAEDEIVYLPEQMISSLCGSNGLSAGNTSYEALNQGISEILERHVKRHIFQNGYTPPEIPKAFLKEKMPELYETISQIESMGPYKIVLKDASLGIGMPVIGALFVDYQNQRYHSKFGASFSIYVAIERCLTELFQGFDLQNPSSHLEFMTRWDVAYSDNWENPDNQKSQLTSDTGSVPITYMAGANSWEFKEWDLCEGYGKSYFDNKQALSFMIEKLRYFESHIYIRSYSFLGFPTYRIFVPGVSTTHLPLGPKRLQHKREKNCIQILKQYPVVKLNQETLDNCFHYLTTGNDFLFDTFDNVAPEAVQAIFYYCYQQTDKAIASLRSLTKKIDAKKYDCAAMELELQEIGMDVTSRDQLLRLFFEEKYVKFAKRAFRKEEGRQDCTYLIDRVIDPQGKKIFSPQSHLDPSARAKMHITMRNKMRENMPNQAEVKKLFQILV